MSAAGRRPHGRPAPGGAQTRAWRALGVGVLGLLAAGIVVRQPVAAPALTAGLGLAALAVAWRPRLVWVMVLAALPLLDLAPWTGRLYLDEFDALLALLIAVAWVRTPPAPAAAPWDSPLRWALAALAASLVLSSARALLPWPGLDANAFASLASPFNALRIAKGACWAGLLWALARRQRAAGLDVAGAIGQGLVLGLAGVAAFILAERAFFTGWLDLAAPYRVAGPFAAMHIGGAYVECFLVVALPFLLARLRAPAAVGWRMAGMALLVASLYAVMVTFSRAGYAALAFVLTLWLAMGWRRRQGGGGRWQAALVLALASAVTLPFLLGPFAQSRLAQVGRDATTREQHWRHVLSMFDRDLPSLALGMGLGRYPALDLRHSPVQQRSASHGLFDEDGQRHLRLGIGQALYIDQMVAARPASAYRVQLRLRSAGAGARLQVDLCEKWLVSSASCAHQALDVPGPTTDWSKHTLVLDSGAVGASGWPRPVVLSMHTSGAAAIDLASIQLLDAQGRDLLRNGQFQQGMDHWYFSSDQHLAWHTKSLPLAVGFDQGLLGLLGMGSLLVLALGRSARQAWRGSEPAAPVLLALAGFAIVGAVDTLIDTPRFLMLWLLLCGLAADPGLGVAAPAQAIRR